MESCVTIGRAHLTIHNGLLTAVTVCLSERGTFLPAHTPDKNLRSSVVKPPTGLVSRKSVVVNPKIRDVTD